MFGYQNKLLEIVLETHTQKKNKKTKKKKKKLKIFQVSKQICILKDIKELF